MLIISPRLHRGKLMKIPRVLDDQLSTLVYATLPSRGSLFFLNYSKVFPQPIDNLLLPLLWPGPV